MDMTFQVQALWKHVICGIHNLDRKLVSNLAKKSIQGVWGNIFKSVIDLAGLV